MVSSLAMVIMLGQSAPSAAPPMVSMPPPPTAPMPPMPKMMTDPSREPEAKPLRKASQIRALYITGDDYPSEALRKEMQGAVAYKLEITRWGTVSDCTITQSSGHALLDETTCKLAVQRSRFWPALDEQAKPTAGSYSARAQWVLPDSKVDKVASPRPFMRSHFNPAKVFPRAPVLVNYGWNYPRIEDYPAKALKLKMEGTTEFRLELDRQGKAADCIITSSSGSPDLDLKSCEIAKERLSAEPALDLEGKPAPGRVTSGITWSLPVTLKKDRIQAFSNLARVSAPPSIPSPAPQDIDFSVVIDKTGKVTQCENRTKMAKTTAFHMRMCDESAMRTGHFVPYLDSDGKPVARRVNFRNVIEIVPVEDK